MRSKKDVVKNIVIVVGLTVLLVHAFMAGAPRGIIAVNAFVLGLNSTIALFDLFVVNKYMQVIEQQTATIEMLVNYNDQQRKGGTHSLIGKIQDV